MTQQELAEKTGYSQQMLSYILSGKRRPYWHSDKFKTLCEITQTDPVVWMQGTPDEIRMVLAKKTKGVKTLSLAKGRRKKK